MTIRFPAFAPKLVFMSAAAALVAGIVQPVSADVPLPIVDIVPTSSFSTTENAGNPQNPDGQNGFIEIDGTATLPLVVKGLSASYDRVSNGAFDSSLAGVPLPGGSTLYPGASRDILQTFRLDYHNGHFNVEGGFGSRYRKCCPADSLEWHKGFVGVSYATGPIALLNHGVLVFDITANSNRHYSSPQALAALPPGLSLPNGTQVYTTQQAITAVIPIDRKSGVRTATTFLWGALDYPQNGPFPQYYDVFIFSATKQVNEMFGVTANIAQVHQRIQGYPFPPPGFISTSALSVAADFHLDFNKILRGAPPVRQGRPTQPGTPGGPGGPAPIGPTQGGTVSPSPSPAMPGASPAPVMPVGGAAPTPTPAP